MGYENSLRAIGNLTNVIVQVLRESEHSDQTSFFHKLIKII